MKNLYIITLNFLIVLHSTSCGSFLSDVEVSDQLAIKEVFNTAADLEAAIVGAYDGVQHGSLLGRNTTIFSDLISANVDYRSGSFRNIAILQMDPTDFYVENLWAQSYKVIKSPQYNS